MRRDLLPRIFTFSLSLTLGILSPLLALAVLPLSSPNFYFTPCVSLLNTMVFSPAHLCTSMKLSKKKIIRKDETRSRSVSVIPTWSHYSLFQHNFWLELKLYKWLFWELEEVKIHFCRFLGDNLTTLNI